jgi:hypothetical protein
MSVDCTVVFNLDRIIDDAEWSSLIRKTGVDIFFLFKFSLFNFSGFLPCKINEEISGFEVYFDKFDPEERFSEKEKKLAGDRFYEIAFSVSSSASNLDVNCMIIAATIFCHGVDGLMLYGNELPYVGAVEGMTRLGVLLEK